MHKPGWHCCELAIAFVDKTVPTADAELLLLKRNIKPTGKIGGHGNRCMLFLESFDW
jgi:hypothetical protein